MYLSLPYVFLLFYHEIGSGTNKDNGYPLHYGHPIWNIYKLVGRNLRTIGLMPVVTGAIV